MKLIYALYGEHYHIHIFYVDTDEVGHRGARRERIYLILAHKERTIQCYNPHSLYRDITDLIKSKVSTRPRDYFFSSTREVHLAASDLARTRGRKMKPASWFTVHVGITFNTLYFHLFHPHACQEPSINEIPVVSYRIIFNTGSFLSPRHRNSVPKS